MIKRLKAWLAAQREAHNKLQMQNGFDYAAGLLVKGKTPDEVRGMATAWPDPFDKGMVECADYFETIF